MNSSALVRWSLLAAVLSMFALPAQSLAGQIVFQHGIQTSGSSLYVMNDDGSDQRALITNQGGIANPGQPNLFPDSTKLAFSASGPGLAGFSGAEACGYNCVGVYSVIGGTLRRVSPPVVSCAADTSDCATQFDESPSLTEDGRVVYAHVGSIVEPLCTYYDCGVYGSLGTEFLVQSDAGGDIPAEWQTANEAGQFQPTHPLGTPSADPGDASLVAYSGLEDFNCSDVGACGPLTVDESNGTGAYNVTDASCSGSCGNEGGLTVLGWSPGGKYILVDYGTNSTAPGVWIFENQAYSKTNQGSGPFYGTGWWVWKPASGAAVGQGGAITSDTPGQGQVIFTYGGDIVSISGSCWGGTPTITAGQPLPNTIVPTCNSGKDYTTDGQDNSPTWTSSTSTIGIASNNGPPPGGKATSTLGKVAVSGTTVSVTLKCSAGSGKCADTVGLGTDETLHGSKVIAVAAKKTKHEVVIVGARRVALAAGGSKTVKVSLDGAGRKLLKKFHKLPVLVIAVQGGKTFGSHKVTFKYHR